ncbi:hypothetical protein [Nannocystis pusilla]|uniref:hypothetical protein n=1 Tax=Nannocystis pusilla TaxID=889268 RepID=UPI003B7CEB34
MDTHPHRPPETPTLEVCGLEYRWDLARGSFTISGVAGVAFFRDSTLARLLVGFLTTLGPHRFALMMLAEGQRSIDEDWDIISAHASFEAGFAELAKYAYTAGWGRWELIGIDREARRGVFRVHNGWEGAIQRATALNWGVGLVAGKFTGFCRSCSAATAGRARPGSSPTATPGTRSSSSPRSAPSATSWARWPTPAWRPMPTCSACSPTSSSARPRASAP